MAKTYYAATGQPINYKITTEEPTADGFVRGTIELTQVVTPEELEEYRRQDSAIAISSVGMLFGILFTLLTIWFFKGL